MKKALNLKKTWLWLKANAFALFAILSFALFALFSVGWIFPQLAQLSSDNGAYPNWALVFVGSMLLFGIVIGLNKPYNIEPSAFEELCWRVGIVMLVAYPILARSANVVQGILSGFAVAIPCVAMFLIGMFLSFLFYVAAECAGVQYAWGKKWTPRWVVENVQSFVVAIRFH
jgi:hypothetical protein